MFHVVLKNDFPEISLLFCCLFGNAGSKIRVVAAAEGLRIIIPSPLSYIFIQWFRKHIFNF